MYYKSTLLILAIYTIIIITATQLSEFTHSLYLPVSSICLTNIPLLVPPDHTQVCARYASISTSADLRIAVSHMTGAAGLRNPSAQVQSALLIYDSLSI